MGTRRLRVALGATLLTEAALLTILLHHTPQHAFLLYCLMLPLFATAVALLARCQLARQRVLLLVLGAGAIFQLIALTHQPATSDDDYRYIWDAKVQLAGIDPYRYPPQAPQLASLRDDLLFSHTQCPHRIPGGCTAINRPAVRTIYPPLAQAAFTLIRLASFGGHGGQLPLQLAGALGCLLIAWLLARRAHSRGRPLWNVALWAWCPLPILEYGNGAHIDWLAALLAVLALSLAATGRDGRAGLLVGAAIATKLYPGLLLASLLRRRPTLVLGAATGLVALSYLPHVLAVGTKVIGYLPGYLREEGYDSGNRLVLLGWLLPHPIDTVVGAILIAAAAAWVWRRTNPQAPEDSAVLLMGLAMLIATPAYGWYAGPLLALIVMSGALHWLPVALIPTFGNLMHHDLGPHETVLRLLYLAAALIAVAGHYLQSRPRPAPGERGTAGSGLDRLRIVTQTHDEPDATLPALPLSSPDMRLRRRTGGAGGHARSVERGGADLEAT